MKIVDNRHSNAIKFRAIEVGECFLDGGNDLFMKIETFEDSSGNVYNAVFLNDGELLGFDLNSEVFPISATITIC